MASVLITRPQTSSEQLAIELEKRGYNCVLEPMLSVYATAFAAPDLHGLQAVMITSANALNFLTPETAQNLIDLPCFCVGPSTAKKATRFGFKKVFSSHTDGLELAQMIHDKLANKDLPILHIAGRDVDSKASSELTGFGYALRTWTIYQAKPSSQISESTIQLLKERRLDVVLFFSVRSADTFKILLKEYALEACCKGLIAIGLSKTITDHIKALPWQNCTAAAIPSEDAIIAHLIETFPVS